LNLGNRLLARELQNKEASDVIDIEGKVRAIRKRLFKQQLNFIDDPSRNKAILCPRRAGKSHAMVSDMLITCLNKAKARCVYIAITRGHAKRLIWDTMRSLIKEFELSAKFNNRELIIHFEHNDSQIMLGGADSEAEIEKYRGGWFNRVYIDESASFPPSLITTLIEDIISPTLSDYFGVLTLAGTPGVVLSGTF
jgi:phage terminase large subunit